MGLEEVRIVQTLKIQGGKAPSTFVPVVVPIFIEPFYENNYMFSKMSVE